jgi:hypothetical protein
MKRVLFIVSILVISSFVCCRSKDNTIIDLSTPENTIRSYYAAFKTSDFEVQKKTLLSSIESTAKKRFDVVNPILQSYQILKVREAKDRKDDTFHLPEGDVDALVKEIYRDSNESINSFVLRKFDSKWLIIDFVTENEAEIPPDIKVIEEKAKKMLEQEGKK